MQTLPHNLSPHSTPRKLTADQTNKLELLLQHALADRQLSRKRRYIRPRHIQQTGVSLDGILLALAISLLDRPPTGATRLECDVCQQREEGNSGESRPFAVRRECEESVGRSLLPRQISMPAKFREQMKLHTRENLRERGCVAYKRPPFTPSADVEVPLVRQKPVWSRDSDLWNNCTFFC